MAMTEGVGLRERKKQRTQRDLRRVALDLFSQRGFDHVTTDDIAAAAEVSKSTFYRYFESKEDVLLGPATEKLEHMAAALAARPADEPPLTAVHNALLSLAARYEVERDERIIIGRLMRETPSLAARNLEHQVAWQRVLSDFIADRLGTPAGDLVPSVLAANVTSTLRVAMDHWVASDGATDLPSVVDQAFAVLAAGFPEAAAPRRAPSTRHAATSSTRHPTKKS